MKHTFLKGFSIIELSIVLIIIGFIIAGIVIGQSLVAHAKIVSVTNDMSNFRASILSFKDYYDQLPGDMGNARNYWPDCTDDLDNPCNGNNNGKIDWDIAANIQEDFRAWQHLSLSGMIAGGYTGLDAISGMPHNFMLGVNIPASRYENAGYRILYPNPTDEAYGKSGHVIILASIVSAGNLTGSVMPPLEARAVDVKIDDGDPDEGNLITLRGSDVDSSKCLTGTNKVMPATYRMNDTSRSCRMWLYLDL